MTQVKNTIRPVVLLSHIGQYLVKLSITGFNLYLILFEYLRYKVFIYFLCRLFGGNIFLMLTTLYYNSNHTIKGGCKLLIKVLLLIHMFIAYFFNLYVTRSLYFVCAGHLVGKYH